MKKLRFYGLFLFLFAVAFVWASAQISKVTVQKKIEPTAFEKRCSICHSLEDVRTGMEKIIKQMHDKAGIKISEQSLKEVEATFTLLPLEEPQTSLFQEKCGKCHSLDLVVKAHQTKDDAEMQAIMEKMAEKEKSGISKDEIEKIHQSMFILNEIYEPDVELMKKEEEKKEKEEEK